MKKLIVAFLDFANAPKNLAVNIYLFLDASAKLRRATIFFIISLYPSVSPSVCLSICMEELGFQEKVFFYEILHLSNMWK